MWSELKRLIDNIASVGTISETKSADGKALARVKLFKRTTDFYPILSFSNLFKRHFIPARVGEQVLVIHPFGEASVGFIIRGIFNKSRKEHPLANDHTEVIDYEDGTVITYDTKAKKLSIKCVGDMEIEAKNITIKANNTTFVGGGINHDGIDISKAHNHPQNGGDHYGGGTNTSPPNGA